MVRELQPVPQAPGAPRTGWSSRGHPLGDQVQPLKPGHESLVEEVGCRSS
jgi:hypothetical protein